jgi:hypothetical protein
VASVSPPFEPGANRGAAYVPTELTGDSLRAALEAAATWLELQAASVNALNVFPVPDGDTGTNRHQHVDDDAGGGRSVRRRAVR